MLIETDLTGAVRPETARRAQALGYQSHVQFGEPPDVVLDVRTGLTGLAG
jgi:hypothetical protein